MNPASLAPARLYLLVGLMVMSWSLNYIVGKVALRELQPILVAGLRIGFAALFLLPIFWWEQSRRSTRFSGFAILQLIALGICGVGFNQLFFVIGLNRTSVGHSALMIALTPMLVLLIACGIGQERITTLKLMGISLAICGVASLQMLKGQQGGPTLLGDAFVFLASLTFALFTVFGKGLSHRFSGIAVTTFAYVASAVALSPMAVWQARDGSLGRASWRAWASVLFMALFPSVLSYLTYYYLLTFLPASRVSAFSYLQPLVAALLAAPILQEQLSPSVVAGGALVLSGVWLTERGG